MERQEILNKFIQILRDNLCFISADTIITEDTKIIDLNFDELDCVEIEIESEIQFELPKESCDCLISNSEIIKEVIDKLSNLLNK